MRNKILTTLLAFGFVGQAAGMLAFRGGHKKSSKSSRTASSKPTPTETEEFTREYGELKYGFDGVSGSKILVSENSSANAGQNGFYIDRTNSLFLRLDNKKYEILNISCNNIFDSTLHFKEIKQIKRPIYSSTNTGTPPSLIAADGAQFYLIYVSEKGVYDFNEKYKFSITPLTDEDLDTLSTMSKSGDRKLQGTLSGGQKVSIGLYVWMKYLVITPNNL